VSVEAARRLYGVVLTADGAAVDEPATQRCRQSANTGGGEMSNHNGKGVR
jgi:hypothetical protein